jgi:hypothetical protein
LALAFSRHLLWYDIYPAGHGLDATSQEGANHMRLTVAVILTVFALLLFNLAVVTSQFVIPHFAGQSVLAASESAVRASLPLASLVLAFLLGWMWRPASRQPRRDGAKPASNVGQDAEVAVFWGVLPWLIVFIAVLSHIFARTSAFSEMVILLTQIIIGAILGMMMATFVNRYR